MNFDFPFNTAETAFIALYILSLVFIGWLGMRAQREKSMQDFYLGGRGIGFVVLLLTLYATQYSGNTLFGFTGKAYSVGFQWLVCVHFMTAIVVFYTMLAPKLYPLARKHGFITPSDYLTYRFKSRAMSGFASLVMILGLANYLLAQLKALGEASRGFLPEHPTTAYIAGVVALALIIVVYETLGGFRAVAWTDVIQGVVLMFGFAIVVWLVFQQFGGLARAIDILEAAAEDRAKVAPPHGKQIAEWISWIFIVGLGGALYPQAVQRIYAAKSAPALRRSLAVMAFLPLTTTLIAVLFGVVASAQEEIQVDGSGDAILTTVCRMVQEQSPGARWLVVILFAGVLAALMSTADSVLLSISSMFTKDVYSVYIRPDAGQAELTLVGKCCSWSVIALMTVAAIVLRDITLVTILKIKFELLVQLAPAFIIGVNWRRLSAGWTFAGMAAGVVVAMTMTFTPGIGGRFLGIHAGLYGLAVNLLLAVGGSLLFGDKTPQPETGEE